MKPLRFAVAFALILCGSDVFADTFVVTNTNDSGVGSLREAINAANASTEPGFHFIRFNIPCSGAPPIVQLQSDLPTVVGPVDIDGGTPCGNVVIDRANGINSHGMGLKFVFTPSGYGFDLYQALRHVDIQNAYAGVLNQFGQQYSGRTGMWISGCRINNCYYGVQLDHVTGALIGDLTNVDGSAPANGGNVIANSAVGIQINQGGGHVIAANTLGKTGNFPIEVNESSNNTIGGLTSANRNYINPVNSSNTFGIYIHSRLGAGGNKILGNYIGIDATGAVTASGTGTSQPNGILVSFSPDNLIQGNVVSGCNYGIKIEGSGGPIPNKLYGNHIGTDPTGSRMLGDVTAIEVNSAPGTIVGDATPGLGNVIGGSRTGMFLASADKAVIQGNFIGTNEAGVVDLGNSGPGIYVVNSNGVIIGGAPLGSGNVIAYNAAGGIVLGSPPSGTTPPTYPINCAIRGNSIYQNGGTTQGIDLNGDGPTPNEVGDADEGANHLQNFPVLSSANTRSGGNSNNPGDGSTSISGTLSSAPSTTYTVDFYSTGPSPNNNRQRQFYLGSQQVTTDATGSSAFTFTFTQPVLVPTGNTIVATATDSAGNTSEFSAPVTVTGEYGAGDVQLRGTVSAATARIGATIRYTFIVPPGPVHQTFVDALPAGLTLGDVTVGRTASQYSSYSVTKSGNTVTVKLSGYYTSDTPIAIDATVNGNATPGSYLTNRASLFSTDGPDADPFNNSVALTTRVIETSSLLNISTRMPVLTGTNAAIGGFIVTGASPKKVMIRGIGPSLRANGIGDALADPTIELHDSTGALIGYNDNWRDSDAAAIQATGLAPSDNAEAALIAMLPANNSGYTAVLRGKNDTIGVGLVEVYDLGQDTDSRLANISTRGYVDQFDNVMIGGVIVGPTGSAPARIVVRALGPSLTSVPGALQDPTVELHDGNGTTIDANDNWKDRQQSEIEATAIAPTDDRESALVTTVAPGNYTAVLRGQNGTTGPALIEVYNLN